MWNTRGIKNCSAGVEQYEKRSAYRLTQPAKRGTESAVVTYKGPIGPRQKEALKVTRRELLLPMRNKKLIVVVAVCRG
jgi:hypothetical protein